MKTILFDMDGTLLDSQADIAASINHTRQARGLEPLALEVITRAINDPAINAAELLYGEKEYTALDRDRFEAHYHEQCLDTVALYEGVDELLEALKARDCVLAVATNANRRFAERMLSHLGIDHHFGAILGAGCVPKAKPHPDMLHEARRRLGCGDPARAVMVGDNEKDMLAARAAGIKGLFAHWGYGSGSALAAAAFDHPHALLEFLLKSDGNKTKG